MDNKLEAIALAEEFMLEFPDNTSTSDMLGYIMNNLDINNKYDIVDVILLVLKYLGEI